MDIFTKAFVHMLEMNIKPEKPNDKYKEILVLEKMLYESGIPYTKKPLFGGWNICYPNEENCACSAVENYESWGSEADKIEVTGLMTGKEKPFDNFFGTCSAQEVFCRIKNHYESEVNNASKN